MGHQRSASDEALALALAPRLPSLWPSQWPASGAVGGLPLGAHATQHRFAQAANPRLSVQP
eukprot:4545588-Alexandrium_andersonii.AAC.1